MESTGILIGLWFAASIAGVGGWNVVKFLLTRGSEPSHVDRSVRAVPPPAASSRPSAADVA